MRLLLGNACLQTQAHDLQRIHKVHGALEPCKGKLRGTAAQLRLVDAETHVLQMVRLREYENHLVETSVLEPQHSSLR